MRTHVSRSLTNTGVLISLVVTAGCAGMRHIAPMDHMQSSASFDTGKALQAANTDAHWPASDWYSVYGDPQLGQWIARARAASPTLAMAAARLREARALAGMAASAEEPRVDGTIGVARHNWPENGYYGPGVLGGNTTWDDTASLALSYNLDLWGSEKNGAIKALDAAHATAADARAAELELEVNIVRTYVDLSQNYALLDIAQQTLQQQQQIAALARRRFAGGIGTQLEVSQTQASLPEAERQLEAYQETIDLERNELAALAGQGPGAGDEIRRPALSLTAPRRLPSVLPAELLGHRPDVVAARWMVAAQARGIDMSKAQFYPNINLLASVSQMAAGGRLLTFLTGPDRGWSAGPAITLPVFDGGQLRSQLGAASAQYDEAVDHYNATLVSALKDIANQVIRLRSLDLQLETASRSIADARASYDLASNGYRRGLTDYLSVLAAQSQLLREEAEQAHISAQRLDAFALLSAALGGGLDEPNDMPSDNVLSPSKHLSRFASQRDERDVPVEKSEVPGN